MKKGIALIVVTILSIFLISLVIPLTSAALTDNLTHYWNMDETVGNITADQVGLTNGTITSLVRIKHEPGKINYGTNYTTTTNAGIDISNESLYDDIFNGSNPFSIAVWVRNTATDCNTASGDTVFAKGQNTPNGFFSIHYVDSGADCKPELEIEDNSGNRYRVRTVSDQWQKDIWTHWVITYNGSVNLVGSTKIYINGTSVPISMTSSAVNTIMSNNIEAVIGEGVIGTSAAYQWVGDIDELGLWDRVLTAGEASELWASGSGLAWPFAGAALELDIVSPLNQTYNVSSITFNVTNTSTAALDTCNFTINNWATNYSMTVSGSYANYTNSSMDDGQYTAEYWCNDSSNAINNTELVTFKIDTIQPQINFTLGTAIDYLNVSRSWIFVNVTWNETNTDTLTFRLHNSTGEYNITSYTTFTDPYSINWTGLPDDIYTYNVTINDSAGFSNTTLTRTITLNTSNPLLAILSPLNQSYNVSSILFNISSDVTLDICTFTINNGATNYTMTVAGAYANYTNGSMIDAQYTADFWCNNSFNNINNTESVTFIVDTTVPQINYTLGTPANDTNQSYNDLYINITWNDTFQDTLLFRLHNSTGEYNVTNYTTFTDPYSINFTGLTDGIYYYNVTINDSAGFSNTTLTREILIDTLAPNVTFVSPADYINTTNSSFNFTVNLSDEFGIKNATLYIYNSTGDLYNSSTVNFIAGTTTKTLGIVMNLLDGIYTWFFQVFDWADNSNREIYNESVFIGLTSYWAFEETNSSNRTVVNSVNRTLDANITGGLKYIRTSNGLIGKGLNVTPTATNIILKTYANYTKSINYTFSFWIYYNSSFTIQENPQFLYNGMDQIYWNTSSGIIHTDGGVSPPYTRLPMPNAWTHFLLTYNGNTGETQMFFNGTLNASGTANGTHGNLTLDGELWMFNTINVFDYWYGFVDEIGIWNRILSSSEIAQIYNNGNGTTFNTVRHITVDNSTPEINYSTGTPVDYANLSSTSIFVNTTWNETNPSAIVFRLHNATAEVNVTTYSSPSGGSTDITWTGLPESNYTYNVTINDTTGNSNFTLTRTVTLNHTAPLLTIVSPLNQSYNVSSILFNISANKLLGACNFTINNWATNYSMTIDGMYANYTNASMDDGQYVSRYWCNDTSGNINNTENVTFRVDATPPKINYTSPTPSSGTNQSFDSLFINVTWIEINPDTLLFRLHNSTGEYNVTNYTTFTDPYSINWTGLRDGTYFFNVTINDTAGFSNITDNRSITIDTTNPLVTIVSPSNTSYIQNNMTFNVSIVDTTSIIACLLDLNGKNYTMTMLNNSYANYSNTSMTDAHHTALFWCNDTMGNTNGTESVQFEIDSLAPVLNITYPLLQIDYHRNATNLTFNWSYVELNPDTCFLDYTGVNFTVNCTDNSSIYHPVNITNYTNRNVTFWMNDTAGSTGIFTRNWTYKFYERNTTYDSWSYEGDYQTFLLNMSTDNASRVNLSYLVYNGSSYLATKGGVTTNINFTRSINVPMVGQDNQSFFWNVIYGDSNSNVSVNSTYLHNQSIIPIVLTRCNSSVDTPYYNFTFKDEVNTTLSLNASTNSAIFVYYLNNSLFNNSYTFSNLTANPSYGFCFTPPNRTLYVGSVDYEYSATNYPLRKWDNTSVEISANYTINKTLWLLSSLDGQYVTFTVSDTGGTALNGSEIDITRVIDGNTVQVGSDTTDATGTATFFLYPAAAHTVAVTRVNCTSANLAVTPTQTSYSITLNCLGGSTIGGNTDIEGIRYSRSPFVGGTTYVSTSSNVTFDYYVVSLLYNITKAKFELYYSNGTFIASNETFVPTAYCNATQCYMKLTLNVSEGDDIKARYYIAVNNTNTGETGYVLLEADARWRFITRIDRGAGTVKKTFNNLRDLFYVWRPVGADPLSGWDFTDEGCELLIDEVSCNTGGCRWENSTASTDGTCISLNHLNRVEYSRIVFIFLFIAITLTIFGRLTGYDAQNPGIFLIFITGLIMIGTFANGITGPGFFYYDSLTPVPFLNNTMLFLTVGFFTLGYYLSLTRRGT